MQKASRMAFNTVITYARLAVTIVISLYSTRLVLNALGARDFGLFNVIGGVVGMLSFLNVAMSTSTQRNITFSLGTGDAGKLKKVFANSLLLHYIIGVVLVIVIEIVGLYFINYKLEIDPDRIGTANLLLHFVVISTFVSIISVPYDALINAHENMLFLAIVSIIEAVLKLAAAVYLFSAKHDKLLVYGLLTALTAIIIRIIKGVYSRRKYSETHVTISKEYDRKEIKGLTFFASWNLLGVMCYIGRNQGMAVVMNMFFSTVVNAAYGIASQVNGQLSFFSSTIVQAIQPQIVKSEGSGDRNRLVRLSIFLSKISVFLFLVIAIPIYIELPLILKLWLKNVPENTVIFCRLIIILTFVLQLRTGITIAVHAIGDIRKYILLNAPIQLLAIPVGYVLFKMGYPSYSIIVASIVIESVALVVCVYFFKSITGYPVRQFYANVVFPSLAIIAVSYFVSHLMFFYNDNYIYKIAVFLISITIILVLIFFFGLNQDERGKVKALVTGVKNKLLSRTA